MPNVFWQIWFIEYCRCPFDDNFPKWPKRITAKLSIFSEWSKFSSINKSGLKFEMNGKCFIHDIIWEQLRALQLYIVLHYWKSHIIRWNEVQIPLYKSLSWFCFAMHGPYSVVDTLVMQYVPIHTKYWI